MNIYFAFGFITTVRHRLVVTSGTQIERRRAYTYVYGNFVQKSVIRIMETIRNFEVMLTNLKYVGFVLKSKFF
jgi:hypothetical protein